MRIQSILLLLMLTGCQALPSPSLQAGAPATARLASADAQNLYPLTVGTRLEYRLTQYKNGQATGRVDTMATEVVEARQTAEGLLAKVHRRYGNMVVPATEALVTAKAVRLARWPEAAAVEAARSSNASPWPFALAHGPDGVGNRLTDQELTTSLDVLHFPLVVGDSWTGRVWTFAKETLTARGWETVTTPAGTYRAWHVTHRLAYDDGRTDDLAYWYAPGVGMVKAHEENTLVTNGTATRYSVEGELAAHRRGSAR